MTAILLLAFSTSSCAASYMPSAIAICIASSSFSSHSVYSLISTDAAVFMLCSSHSFFLSSSAFDIACISRCNYRIMIYIILHQQIQYSPTLRRCGSLPGPQGVGPRPWQGGKHFLHLWSFITSTYLLWSTWAFICYQFNRLFLGLATAGMQFIARSIYARRSFSHGYTALSFKRIQRSKVPCSSSFSIYTT